MAVCEDGPLAGHDSYAANEIGCTVTFSLPPVGSAESYTYVLTRVGSANEPARLTFVQPNA
jgi:hypothetical protein